MPARRLPPMPAEGAVWWRARCAAPGPRWSFRRLQFGLLLRRVAGQRQEHLVEAPPGERAAAQPDALLRQRGHRLGAAVGARARRAERARVGFALGGAELALEDRVRLLALPGVEQPHVQRA